MSWGGGLFLTLSHRHLCTRMLGCRQTLLPDTSTAPAVYKPGDYMDWQQQADALAESLSKPGCPPNAHATVRGDLDTLIQLVEDDPDAAEALQARLRSMYDLPHGGLVRSAMSAGWEDRLESIIEPGTMDRYPILN